MDGKKHFQVTLKGLRVIYGLRQKDAAKLIGVSTDTWAHYENGKTFPNTYIIKRIEDIFNISYDNISFKSKLRLNRTEGTT